jgi:hypothetical protein
MRGHTLSPIDLIALTALGPPKNRQIDRVLDPSWTLNREGLLQAPDRPQRSLDRCESAIRLRTGWDASACEADDKTEFIGILGALCRDCVARLSCTRPHGLPNTAQVVQDAAYCGLEKKGENNKE